MSNCGVGSGGFGLPGDVVSQHGVEGGDHLAHDGDDDDFRLFVGGGETTVEDVESRIVPASAQSCHVEHVTDWHSAAVDAAMSFELATVEVVRRKSDKGSDLLAAHLAELRQQCDEGEGERGADALHRGQEFITPSEIGIAGNDLSHASVEQKDISLEPRQATFVEAPQHDILKVGGLVFDRDMLVAKLSPHGDDLGELLCGRIALHDPCWHDRNVFCDQPRIEAVVLGEHATGAAKLAQLVGVDASHRQVRRQQGSDDGALVAATRLDANCSDRQAPQSFDQLAVTGGVVIHRKGFPVWQHHHVETIFRYVNSTVTMLYHLRAPALLMRAHALATVREWKKRLEHQAHSRFKSRGGCGLPVATGAVS
jgi:hypothetical protein